jgi:hypothetical protein
LTPDLYIVKLLVISVDFHGHTASPGSLVSFFSQVGAVDSSYDAHDDLEVPGDAASRVTSHGGAAAFTSQRLQGSGGTAQ